MSLLEAKRTESKHDPGGGGELLWKRLDISRHEVIELCGEKGRELFKFLLTSCTLVPGQDDMAVCPLQRLHDVALQLHASPDTVKRYVAVFRALSLVQHYHDQRREGTLHIPLGPYRPLTNFTTLDELIGMRKKQRQLAQKVKLRYITRFGDPTESYSDEIRTKFQELGRILEGEHLEPLKRQRLQMKIADLLTQLVRAPGCLVGDSNAMLSHLPGRSITLAEEGDPNEGQEVFCSAKKSVLQKAPSHVGDLNLLEGDFILQETLASRHQAWQTGDLNPQQGDLTIPASLEGARQSEQQGDPKTERGDSLSQMLERPDQVTAPPYGVLGDSEQPQGDLIAVQSTKRLQSNDPLGDSKQPQGDLIAVQSTKGSQSNDPLGDSNEQTMLKEGDSKPVEVHANAPYTYNVNYLINNITGNNVIRKQLAQFLASILEKNEYEHGYPTFSKYLKAFKLYTPEVIGRAFLATMVLLYQRKWQVEKPGALFTDQCRILSGQLPFAQYTIEDVDVWLRTWGNVPYSDLIVAMTVPQSSVSSVPEPAPLVTRLNHAPSSTGGLPKTGSPGYGGVAHKKRTYGLQYTGRSTTLNRGTNNWGSPTAPSEES